MAPVSISSTAIHVNVPQTTRERIARTRFNVSFSECLNCPALNCSISACGGEYRYDRGSIDFPAGGENYVHNLNCVYLIEVDEGKVVNLTFSSFHLEASSPCTFDWLQVKNAHFMQMLEVGFIMFLLARR